MFTGLVEGCGRVHAVVVEDVGLRLDIVAPADLRREGCAVGESVALNGCCLTVVDNSGAVWAFQAGPETLSKTNLGGLKPGDLVNLERALLVSGRLGGHFVQGHVDGVGWIDEILVAGEWVTIWFRAPPALTLQMVPKGSIAVDGVSLTLVTVEPERFSVALIPHTLQVTTLGAKAVGAPVNLETDLLAKYVQKLWNGSTHAAS